mmetsp:Transcript_71288/g.122518  ORF Transcript_71288/g.122518 Transcript_71288/m.122518 type:complete len:80 (+) Transcript_71288:2-241(+)
MPEQDPLRAEIKLAADELRTLKNCYFSREEVKAMPKETVNVFDDPEVQAKQEQVKALTVKLGQAMKAAGNPTFLPYSVD